MKWIIIIQFQMNYSPWYSLFIGYNEDCTKSTVNKKLLGLQIDNHLNSHNHTALMVQKLGWGGDAVITTLCISITDILK